MLVLSRKINDAIVIGQSIELEVLEIRGRIVRIGIKAPRGVPVVRAELIVDQEASSSGECDGRVREPLLFPTAKMPACNTSINAVSVAGSAACPTYCG